MQTLADFNPPHDYDYEKVVLGYLMDPRVHDRFIGIVKPEHFWDDRHRDVFNAVAAVSQSGGVVTHHSVYARLKEQNLHDTHGGIGFLRECSAAIVTTAGDVEWFGRELRRIHVQRQVMEAGASLMQLAARAGDTSEGDLLGEALEVVIAIDESSGDRKGPRSLAEVIDGGVREQVISITNSAATDARYIPTGLPGLDYMIRGFRKSGLYLVSAATSAGKSLWVQDRALYLAERRHPVLIFTTEMADEDVVARQVFMAAGRDEHVVRRLGDERDAEHLSNTMTYIHDWPITYVDDSNMAIERLEVEVRQQVRTRPPALIIVDHFHELSTERRFSREDLALEYIADRLKKIARRYDVPLVAVAQQNRGDHSGNLNAALKGTSALEQKADTVVFLRGTTPDGSAFLDPDAARERASNPGWMRVRATASKVRTGGMTGSSDLCLDWTAGGRFYDWPAWAADNRDRIQEASNAE